MVKRKIEECYVTIHPPPHLQLVYITHVYVRYECLIRKSILYIIYLRVWSVPAHIQILRCPKGKYMRTKDKNASRVRIA